MCVGKQRTCHYQCSPFLWNKLYLESSKNTLGVHRPVMTDILDISPCICVYIVLCRLAKTGKNSYTAYFEGMFNKK